MQPALSHINMKKSFFVMTLFIASCFRPVTNNTQKNTRMENTRTEILELLESLNYWASKGGDPDHPVGSDIKSTGESHSKFLDLKEKIRKANYHIKWEDGKYVLEDVK